MYKRQSVLRGKLIPCGLGRKLQLRYARVFIKGIIFSHLVMPGGFIGRPVILSPVYLAGLKPGIYFPIRSRHRRGSQGLNGVQMCIRDRYKAYYFMKKVIKKGEKP